eukprot:TRINITY_DN19170_c0_g1_i1.p1 TRINITY_DN19170_c0_g1~~TRINITY_DN19170_c0_g1_i1.p1  ORF type:complete len:903 (+),score=120.25 TRINITY_DN19170_c0_g1_i1:677-3385(+)
METCTTPFPSLSLVSSNGQTGSDRNLLLTLPQARSRLISTSCSCIPSIPQSLSLRQSFITPKGTSLTWTTIVPLERRRSYTVVSEAGRQCRSDTPEEHSFLTPRVASSLPPKHLAEGMGSFSSSVPSPSDSAKPFSASPNVVAHMGLSSSSFAFRDSDANPALLPELVPLGYGYPPPFADSLRRDVGEMEASQTEDGLEEEINGPQTSEKNSRADKAERNVERIPEAVKSGSVHSQELAQETDSETVQRTFPSDPSHSPSLGLPLHHPLSLPSRGLHSSSPRSLHVPSVGGATASPKKRQAAPRRTRHVAVIGAGVAGVAACKALTAVGHKVTVFETRPSLGGVWSHTYASTSLQTPRSAYRFSDWPWPDSASTHPSHTEVVQYLESYVEHFGLGEKFEFNARVAEMRREEWAGRSGWQLRVQSRNEDEGGRHSISEKWHSFDYVLMCCGCFGDIPNIPSFPDGGGPQVFHGRVLHSADYSDLDVAESSALLGGKKVVVVGFQKTAIDLALEAAQANAGPGGQPVTLLFRRPHWLVPRHPSFLGVPLPYLLLNRVAELFVPKPKQHVLVTLLQKALPLRSLVSHVIERILLSSYPVERHGLVPPHSFWEDVSGCILPQLPRSFFPALDSGLIRTCRSPGGFHFTPGGVQLADGRQVDADVVLLCTGYRGIEKLTRILPEEYRGALERSGRSLYLYRGTVHPHIPDAAFLGYNDGLSCCQSSEMGARWLAELIRGTFALPPVAQMEADAQQWLDLKKGLTPFHRVSCIAPVHAYFFDTLCKDMGWNPLRKRGLLANWFAPHGSTDYFEEVVREEEEEEAEVGVSQKGREVALQTTTSGVDFVTRNGRSREDAPLLGISCASEIEDSETYSHTTLLGVPVLSRHNWLPGKEAGVNQHGLRRRVT